LLKEKGLVKKLEKIKICKGGERDFLYRET